jgi:hypothetical protein
MHVVSLSCEYPVTASDAGLPEKLRALHYTGVTLEVREPGAPGFSTLRAFRHAMLRPDAVELNASRVGLCANA